MAPLHSQKPVFQQSNSDNILPNQPGPKSLFVISDSAWSKKCMNFAAESGVENITLVVVVYILMQNSF